MLEVGVVAVLEEEATMWCTSEMDIGAPNEEELPTPTTLEIRVVTRNEEGSS
jgi:hypothetical protein